jgi:endonuclease YncB( thermonuclease family)
LKEKPHRKVPGFYRISDVRAIDGDALDCVIHLPFGTLARKRARLKGWWAPELTGPHSAAGQECQRRLQEFVNGKQLFLHCPNERTDKYGRILGALMWSGAFVDPVSVLGLWQLTAAAHKAQLDESRRKKGPPPGGMADWSEISGADPY